MPPLVAGSPLTPITRYASPGITVEVWTSKSLPSASVKTQPNSSMGSPVVLSSSNHSRSESVPLGLAITSLTITAPVAGQGRSAPEQSWSTASPQSSISPGLTRSSPSSQSSPLATQPVSWAPQ